MIWVVECKPEGTDVWLPTVFVGLSRKDARRERLDFLQGNDCFKARVRKYLPYEKNRA